MSFLCLQRETTKLHVNTDLQLRKMSSSDVLLELGAFKRYFSCILHWNSIAKAPTQQVARCYWVPMNDGRHCSDASSSGVLVFSNATGMLEFQYIDSMLIWQIRLANNS